MGRVRIVSNKLPQIESRLESVVQKGVENAGEELVTELKGTVWHRWGYVERATRTYPLAGGIAVGVGEEHGHGFYAIYNEFGTSKQGARPVVTPAAHAFETRYGEIVAEEVRKIV